MWRWISGLPRALRQHLHVPRASAANVCPDDEAVEDKETEKRDEVKHKEKLRCSFRYKNFKSKVSSKTTQEEKSKGGPGKEKDGHNFQQHFDFWSLFNRNHRTLEALGWGAAVVLGIQLTKHQHWTRDTEHHGRKQNNCLIYRVVHALPGTGDFTTKKSIIETDNKLHVDADEPQKPQVKDPLTEVMNQFEGICKKYTGVGRNIEGLVKARKGDFKDATRAWREASQLGYVKSQYNLGLCYEIGKGVKQNYQEAIKHYELAADEGHLQALYNMALIYLKGEGGIEKNPRLAISLLESAANLGLCEAQTYLGVHYTESETKDMEKAVSFFKSAADQNDAEAQYFLGICYEQGWGVEPNECKAAALYTQAASGGHEGAMYNLAVFHHYGLGGLPEDHVSAKELFEKAAAAGNPNAKSWLETPPEVHIDHGRLDTTTDTYIDQGMFEDSQVYMDGSQILEIQPLKQNDKVLKRMNSSTSSPSLTDYIRKHLNELEIGKIDNQALTKLDLLNMASPTFDSVLISTNSYSSWQPLYGSPKMTAVPVLETGDTSVCFSLGADEDDLDELNQLNSSIENLSWNEDIDVTSHRFCSMIQRNSTMPNLQTISCT